MKSDDARSRLSNAAPLRVQLNHVTVGYLPVTQGGVYRRALHKKSVSGEMKALLGSQWRCPQGTLPRRNLVRAIH